MYRGTDQDPMRDGSKPSGRTPKTAARRVGPGRRTPPAPGKDKEVFRVKLKKLLSVLLLLALLAGLAPAALTAYAEGEAAKVKGLSFTGKGYTEKEGVYSPDFKEKKASFKGQAAPEKAYELQVSSFFTDAKGKKPLKIEPVEGETYYFQAGMYSGSVISFRISNIMVSDRS